MAVEPGYPPAPARRPSYSWASLGARLILTLAGAAGMIISAFLQWFGRVGVNLDVRAFWESNFGRRSGTFVATVGFVMIVLGLVAILGLAPRSGWLTRLAGALAIAAFVLFVIEVYRGNGDIRDADVGAWIALAGGVVALIGGFFGTRTVATTVPAVE